MSEIHGIKIDYSRDSLFDELGLIRLRESYMREDETSPQERFAYVSKAFGSNDNHAQRLYDYSSRHWLSYATPVLSFGRSRRGLPISCFAGDTEIMTSEGLKLLKDIKVGDMVLSHDGTYNAVEAIKVEESDDIYELKIDEEVFHVTGNHLVLTKEDGWVRVDELDLDRHNIVQIKGRS